MSLDSLRGTFRWGQCHPIMIYRTYLKCQIWMAFGYLHTPLSRDHLALNRIPRRKVSSGCTCRAQLSLASSLSSFASVVSAVRRSHVLTFFSLRPSFVSSNFSSPPTSLLSCFVATLHVSIGNHSLCHWLRSWHPCSRPCLRIRTVRAAFTSALLNSRFSKPPSLHLSGRRR